MELNYWGRAIPAKTICLRCAEAVPCECPKTDTDYPYVTDDLVSTEIHRRGELFTMENIRGAILRLFKVKPYPEIGNSPEGWKWTPPNTPQS